MRGTAVAVAVIAALGLQGCGENCQSTCEHVYAESECGIVFAGVSSDELIADCTRSCEEALQITGKQGFDPFTVQASDQSVSLTNEAEAAAWIDCVWTNVPDEGPSKQCANIDPKQGGVCAPI